MLRTRGRERNAKKLPLRWKIRRWMKRPKQALFCSSNAKTPNSYGAHMFNGENETTLQYSSSGEPSMGLTEPEMESFDNPSIFASFCCRLPLSPFLYIDSYGKSEFLLFLVDGFWSTGRTDPAGPQSVPSESSQDESAHPCYLYCGFRSRYVEYELLSLETPKRIRSSNDITFPCFIALDIDLRLRFD